jgi:hypothetical protein
MMIVIGEMVGYQSMLTTSVIREIKKPPQTSVAF